MREVDVVIVGSGPAGMSTALHLVRLDPGWAGRIVVLDKAIHPREKICGGGVTKFGVRVLANLGLEFQPAHVAANEVRLVFEQNVFSLSEPSIVRITRRDEFDHWLVRCGEQRGVEVRQGEGVIDIQVTQHRVNVITAAETYAAKVVVAADGASSFVRRRLEWGGPTAIARLLEILTPERAGERAVFRDGVALFDFTPMLSGLQGYYWDFPSLIAGQPYMNRGVFDSRVRPELPRVPLKRELAQQLAKRGIQLAQHDLKGHPIHWFDSAAEFSRPRVLLAGDAAGTDPLFGEGIAFALAYGDAAAAEIASAFETGDFGLAGYRARLLANPLLMQLGRRTWIARRLYKLPEYPLLARLLWRLAPLFFRLLTWYRPDYIPLDRPRMFRRRSLR